MIGSAADTSVASGADVILAMGTVTVIEGILMARVGPGDRQAMELWRGARRVQARVGRERKSGKRQPTARPEDR
jgi:hypothetical protein